MLDITSCNDCTQIKYCQVKEDYKEEVELLLAVQNKFDNTIVTAHCHRFQRDRFPNEQTIGVYNE